MTFLRLTISGGALWTAYDEALFADDCPGAAVGEELPIVDYSGLLRVSAKYEAYAAVCVGMHEPPLLDRLDEGCIVGDRTTMGPG